MKQYILNQITRICSKAVIIGINAGTLNHEWDGQGEPPFVLSFPPEEKMNKRLEIEQSMLLSKHNLSDHVTELAKMNSISKEEAQIRLQEILANNKKKLEETILKIRSGKRQRSDIRSEANLEFESGCLRQSNRLHYRVSTEPIPFPIDALVSPSG